MTREVANLARMQVIARELQALALDAKQEYELGDYDLITQVTSALHTLGLGRWKRKTLKQDGGSVEVTRVSGQSEPVKFVSVTTVAEGESNYALIVALGADGCVYQRKATDLASKWEKFPSPVEENS